MTKNSKIPVNINNSKNTTIRTRSISNNNKAIKETEGKTKNKTNNLQIYQKYLELIYYSNDVLKKYPKKENFTIVTEIKKTLYVGLRNLMYAIKSYNKQNKLNNLNEFDINLTLLKVQVRLSYKYQYITTKNYETWCKLITDICNMLGGWIISCQKR